MTSPEFPLRIEGSPGIEIDEGYSSLDKTSFIDLSVYNEEGDIVFYTDFERNVKLAEIAETLILAADLLIEDTPDEMVGDEAIRLSRFLRDEAKKIL
jgi:hypothetical protein